MKILVTGSEGMLGQAVMKHLAADHVLVGVDIQDGDLTCPADVNMIMADSEPDWVIHCAAWTDVDGAEEHQDQAMAVNAGATALLAAACDQQGAGLTYISTDYVFNGQGGVEGYAEDDTRDPVNSYGLTKARGEEAVEKMKGPWQIVRTSWLFGDGKVNFPQTIRRLLAEKPSLQVVNDQCGCPTDADDLAMVLAYLVSSGGRGIFHATNAGYCTWFDLAREVASELGLDPERISACDGSLYRTAAKRPAYSVLKSSRLEDIGCPERPTWQDAVRRYIHLLESGQARYS